MDKVGLLEDIYNTSSFTMALNLSSGNSLVSESECFHRDSLATKFLRILPHFFIIIVSLIGNSMVVAVVFKNSRMRTTVNYYIVNMAIADLLITLYMPRTISAVIFGYEWVIGGTAGLVLCKLSIFVNQIPMIASIFTVVAISFDRFNAVVFPLRTFVSTRMCKVVIFCTWLIALAFRSPTVYAVHLVPGKNGKLYCNLALDVTFGPGAKKLYYNFNMIAIFTIPFLTTVILYTSIMVTLKRRKAPGLTPENSSNNSEGFKRREVVKKNVLRLVLIVVTAFILCWLLYYIRLILFAYGYDFSCNWLFVRLILAHFNSALNPCLYAIFSENYRKGFKKILSRGNCLKRLPRRRLSDQSRDSNRFVRRSLGPWGSNGSISIRIEGERQQLSTFQSSDPQK